MSDTVPDPDDSSALVDAMGDGVYRLDADGRVRNVNDALLDLTGYSRDALHGDHVSTLFDDDARERLTAGAAVDVAIETTSGEQIPCEVRVNAVGDGRVGVVRERSTDDEDVRAPLDSVSEGSLRDAEEQFQSLVDAVEEYAIFRLDTDGTVISWNEGARAIKGYDADEIVGRHFSAFYTESDRADGVPQANLDAASRNGSVEDEGWRVRENGSQFWANVTITAVYDDDGTHKGFLKVTRDLTDRHRRERELESELEQMLGRISDAFYAVDDEFRFTHVNERAEQLLGRSQEELEGTVMWKVLPEGPGLYEEFQHALTRQESTSFERYFEPLGIWAEVNVYPSETGLSVYLRNVSERKERERELRRTERRFEAMFEDPNILVGLLSPDGTVLDINETAMEYIDAGLADVRGEPFWETPWWGTDEAVQADVREWTERAADGEYVDFETDITGPDDGTNTISGFFRPVVDEDGEVVSIVVSDRDITERKERERELELFRNLLDQSNDALLISDPETGAIRDVNDTTVERLGYDREELFEMTIPDIETELSGQQEWQSFVEELRADGQTTFDGFHRRKDGSTLPVEVEVSYAEFDQEYVLSIARDVTERRETKRKLEESNERLEQFAYVASHDLQEPLRMVSSYLQLIEDRYGDVLDEEGEEFLAFAVDGADRMKAMIEGLLAYSRVETRGDPLVPTDLDSVLADVRRDLQLRIEESGAEISSDPLPTVVGDENQLRQVFQNLVENAIEYSGDDAPEIHIGADRVGDRWRIDVHDDGIGIDPDDQERIFEVFQRLHTRTDHEGTGIGLSLVERIVERHGGEIWVESEPGEGTTFSFTLPAVEE